jgi:hypothetical protein
MLRATLRLESSVRCAHTTDSCRCPLREFTGRWPGVQSMEIRAMAARNKPKKTAKRASKKRASTKMEKAVYIMERLFFKQQKKRKEILPVLMKECRLSRAGASTYYLKDET